MRKPVKGYEGLYEVDDTGRVYSLDRRIGGRLIKAREMQRKKSNCGYMVVYLSRNGKYKTLLVHRIVAEAFVPNPGGLPCVNHKDEDRYNNRAENLEWCTQTYNNNYGHHKALISQALKGRTLPREHRRKISEGFAKHYKIDESLPFRAYVVTDATGKDDPVLVYARTHTEAKRTGLRQMQQARYADLRASVAS